MKTTCLILFWVLTLAFPMVAKPQSERLTQEHENISASIDVPPEIADKEIEKRLTAIFNEVESLNEVTFRISNGVVFMKGTVPDSTSARTALEIVQNTKGVVYVLNELDTEANLRSRLNPAVVKTQQLLREGIRILPVLAVSVIVVVLFSVFGTWVSRRETWLKKLGVNELPANLLQRLMKLLFVSVGIFIALEIMDATALAGAVLGIAGVAGIALGFAFRAIVENYLAGIILSLRNPFSTGDAVELEGVRGKVIRLTSRDTVLMTFDGNHLRIPNSKIMTSTLTNFTRNPLRRFDFAVGVSVELDILEVRSLGLKTLQALDGVLADPPPMIIIEELGDSTINMRFFAWIDQRQSDFLKSKSEAIRLVKDAFDDADIEMPEPIYRVHLRDAGPGVITAKTETKKSRAKQAGIPQEETDTSADHTIDEQVRTAQENDDEPNLLDK